MRCFQCRRNQEQVFSDSGRSCSMRLWGRWSSDVRRCGALVLGRSPGVGVGLRDGCGRFDPLRAVEVEQMTLTRIVVEAFALWDRRHSRRSSANVSASSACFSCTGWNRPRTARARCNSSTRRWNCSSSSLLSGLKLSLSVFCWLPQLVAAGGANRGATACIARERRGVGTTLIT